MWGSFVEPQSSGLYALCKRYDLFSACVGERCEWVLFVVVDQRAGRAEQLVVVAAGVGVFEVLDLAVHVSLSFTFDDLVIHMLISSVKHVFTVL
jgi:hypothetical protein